MICRAVSASCPFSLGTGFPTSEARTMMRWLASSLGWHAVRVSALGYFLSFLSTHTSDGCTMKTRCTW